MHYWKELLRQRKKRKSILNWLELNGKNDNLIFLLLETIHGNKNCFILTMFKVKFFLGLKDILTKKIYGQ